MAAGDRKISVFLNPDTHPDNQATPYLAIVLEWGDGHTLFFNEQTQKQEILPGSEKGGWFNTGIVCWGETAHEAFTDAYILNMKQQS